MSAEHVDKKLLLSWFLLFILDKKTLSLQLFDFLINRERHRCDIMEAKKKQT